MESYLVHHGIAGQKWGVRNAEWYPIDKYKAAQKRAGRLISSLDFRKLDAAEMKIDRFYDDFYKMKQPNGISTAAYYSGISGVIHTFKDVKDPTAEDLIRLMHLYAYDDLDQSQDANSGIAIFLRNNPDQFERLENAYNEQSAALDDMTKQLISKMGDQDYNEFVKRYEKSNAAYEIDVDRFIYSETILSNVATNDDAMWDTLTARATPDPMEKKATKIVDNLLVPFKESDKTMDAINALGLTDKPASDLTDKDINDIKNYVKKH